MEIEIHLIEVIARPSVEMAVQVGPLVVDRCLADVPSKLHASVLAPASEILLEVETSDFVGLLRVGGKVRWRHSSNHCPIIAQRPAPPRLLASAPRTPLRRNDPRIGEYSQKWHGGVFSGASEPT